MGTRPMTSVYHLTDSSRSSTRICAWPGRKTPVIAMSRLLYIGSWVGGKRGRDGAADIFFHCTDDLQAQIAAGVDAARQRTACRFLLGTDVGAAHHAAHVLAFEDAHLAHAAATLAAAHGNAFFA